VSGSEGRPARASGCAAIVQNGGGGPEDPAVGLPPFVAADRHEVVVLPSAADVFVGFEAALDFEDAGFAVCELFEVVGERFGVQLPEVDSVNR